ncbi:N-acyl homoserine lactonase family protein [Ruficoccus amylovorans]|uniref:N-acyl homoserine lactonase family protein n=1 Tax=Ruficoccus amylovorans TaxID=1804625 RepID=A0A842HH61_9BACT|nr:N-acyl homoserine lactonase family protein [Ruficoccus amylovorans]MBC2595863.1 N-acyl homoserine lactonase family protein [Ruficoccus amylovorans]
MKLNLLQCGSIRVQRHLIQGGIGGPPEVPVPFFLIEHNGSRILFDVGYGRSAINAPATGTYVPLMSQEDYVVDQLVRLGLGVDDITHIVISHLHGDHFEGLEAFRDVPCYLQKTELDHVGNTWLSQRYPVDWQWLKGDHDLLGDGRIQILHTPGHSVGHQSVLLTLDSRVSVFLAADAACYEAAFEQRSLPANIFDRAAGLETFEKIDALRQAGAQIIYGHDPTQWRKLLQEERHACME